MKKLKKLFVMTVVVCLIINVCCGCSAAPKQETTVETETETVASNPASEANGEDELIREESPDNNQGEKDEIARESEHGPKEDNSSDDIIREESPDNNQGEKDQIARESEHGQGEAAQKAEEEAGRQEESYGGGYQYTLEDGTVVTTDHDLRDYITPNDRGGYKLDIEKMIEDIWCVNGGSWVRNSVGYSWFNGTESSRGLSWETDSNMLATTIEFFRKEGTIEYRVFLEILECPRPHDYWLGADDNFLILGASGGDGIHPNTAALILHGLEGMEKLLAVNGTEIFDDVSFGTWYVVY